MRKHTTKPRLESFLTAKISAQQRQIIDTLADTKNVSQGTVVRELLDLGIQSLQLGRSPSLEA